MLGGRAHRDTEIGTDGGVADRARPSRCGPQGDHIGALILVRDVTDLRRRDRELVTKDATIREIHHRVKNNLQTVAALLRLQARRIDSPSGAAALEEAVRRVGSIAIVHETLSQAVEEHVDFDEIADRLGRDGHRRERGRRPGAGRAATGTFGVLPSESATALAMVLTELLQNAVEHGYDADAADAAGVRSCVDARSGSSAGCTSRSTTTGAGCRTASTSTARPASACRSCARWSSPSSAASSSSGRGPDGAGHAGGARRTRSER